MYYLVKDLNVYQHYGNVSGGDAVVVQCKNGFTTELNKKYILLETKQRNFKNFAQVEKYFKKTNPEYFV